MTLIIKIIATSDTGDSDSIHQDYTDTPNIPVAMRRAQELILDYYARNVPEGVKWQKLEIIIECVGE